MKILAYAGSNSLNSINKQLVTYATTLLPEVGIHDFETLDLNDFDMPLFSVDKEKELGNPEPAMRFMNKIEECDALIISLAEHNGTYTVAYKNLFDWASRINPHVFQDKAIIYLSTSPGPGGAQSVLAAAVNSAPFFKGHVKGSLSVPLFNDNFDVETGKLKNNELNEELLDLLHSLKA